MEGNTKSHKGLTWLAGFAIFLLLLKVNYDLAVITSAVMIAVFTCIYDRNKMWAWIPAIAIGVVFVYFVRDMYTSYNLFTLKLRGVTIFPAIAWTIMLMIWYLLVEPHVSHKVWWCKWLVNALLYCGGLIAFEYIGYNILGVRLGAGSAYNGWPFLNIFHAPWWMQTWYFFNGIAFIGIVVLFDTVQHKRTGRV